VKQRKARANQQHQNSLQEQKEFYLEKVSGLENQLQTNEQLIAS